jgi:hypothetical protein
VLLVQTGDEWSGVEALRSDLRALEVEVRRQLWRDPPEVLYHYTTGDGLLGIIRDNAVRLSNARYLNDRKEVAHGSSLIADILQARIDALDGEEDLNNATEIEMRIMQAARGGLIVPLGTVLDLYVACLCESGDLLSQWRGYGNGMGGYSLGFEVSGIKLREMSVDEGTWGLWPVTYDPRVQRRIVDHAVDRVVAAARAVEASSEAELTAVVDEACKALAGALFLCPALFKASAFQEEAEWRLLYVSPAIEPYDDRLKFRTGRGFIVPFVPIDISPRVGESAEVLPLRTVICGPSGDSDLCCQRPAAAANDRLCKCQGHLVGDPPKGLAAP